MIATGGSGIEINLTAVILAMRGDDPVVYASSLGATMPPGLPSGPFDPGRHRTLELGLRSFAQEQAGLTLGYVEQLYTFGDRGRLLPEGSGEAAAPHLVSIGYLALTRMAAGAAQRENFLPLYTFFPWEDWRGGRPDILDRVLLPALERWAGEGEASSDAEGRGLTRRERLALSFGVDGTPFDEEKVLERYELLYSAGLVDEARRDRRQAAMPDRLRLGQVMPFDHRRIVATALGRLRGKLKYRPLVFELMADQFTLTDLQRKVEAISGHHLHKQNFRRLVETGGLVEPTGEQTTTKGRPAALFRFRREVLRERPAPGLRLSARGSG
ncbi:NAD regulator [Rhabdaerophilum sp. SD176]|uniref:NUDIX hydrolase n=1 Tax=Rhabdaerophilum sp. SD176 TaxID=2983548 RepID=UPI0024DF616E|nr:NAD regulator [Rhabdaerophilum sp. SD176]